MNKSSRKKVLTAEERNTLFTAKYVVNSENGCWEWTASLSRYGYAQFFREGGSHNAHRYSYRYYRGDIPKDMEVDHLCRNKICVNPKHLELVTHKENMRRWRGNKDGYCLKGHELTKDNIYTQVKPSGNVLRTCKICTREYSRAYHLRKKAKL